METRYKFLRLFDDEIRSESGDCIWRLGEWQSVDEVILCESGFHCSQKIYQAFTYVQGEILAEVEVDGESVVDSDGTKEAWQKMRLVKCWQWRKEDSVVLSIFAAELVLENFEKIYPDDKRPREAIEAAKKWLAEPTEENQSAARSAARSARSAARSAWSAAESAESAARSAARSAWSAARSAESAARSAARSAESAAESAESAARSAESAAESAAWSAWSAWSAARSAIIEKIAVWMDERKAVLQEYKLVEVKQMPEKHALALTEVQRQQLLEFIVNMVALLHGDEMPRETAQTAMEAATASLLGVICIDIQPNDATASEVAGSIEAILDYFYGHKGVPLHA